MAEDHSVNENANEPNEGTSETPSDRGRRIVINAASTRAAVDREATKSNEDTSAASEEGPETVMDILHNLGSEQASILTGFQDYTQSLADKRELDDGKYNEYLDDETKQKILLEEKVKSASERRQQVREEYQAKTLAAHEKLAERREALQAELFGTDSATAMAVALADDAKLQDLVNVAVRTKGEGLAKALLPTISDRGLDELSMPLLKTFPELERSYDEWKALPPPEVLERQADPANLDRVVPRVEADRFVVRPRLER